MLVSPLGPGGGQKHKTWMAATRLGLANATEMKNYILHSSKRSKFFLIQGLRQKDPGRKVWGQSSELCSFTGGKDANCNPFLAFHYWWKSPTQVSQNPWAEANPWVSVNCKARKTARIPPPMSWNKHLKSCSQPLISHWSWTWQETSSHFLQQTIPIKDQLNTDSNLHS